MRSAHVLIVLVGLLVAWPLAPLLAQESEAAPEAASRPLEPGDPAPVLEIAEWIQHEPAQLGAPGRITVVVHWATVNQDTVETFEWLGWVQAHYPVDVVVLSTEAPQTVREFLAASPELATWPVPVAIDAGRLFVERLGWPESPVWTWGYLADAEGRLAATRLDARVVGWMARGHWDVTQGPKRLERVAELEAMLPAAEASGDVAAQLAILDELRWLDTAHGHVVLRTFRLLATDPDRLTEAYERVEQIAAAAIPGVLPPEDAVILNALAWDITTLEGLAYRDLELALELSERSNVLSSYASAAQLDTLARVHHARGDTAAALEWQRKAVDLMHDDADLDDATREDMVRRLTIYEEATRAP